MPRQHPAITKPEPPRRLALKQMASLLGLSLSANALDVLAAEPSTHTTHLNAAELTLTGIIAELIIPATDTPGALAVNAHGFINQYLAECASPTEQKQFLSGLKKINLAAQHSFHKNFDACTAEQQSQLLTAIEHNQMSFDAADKVFFRLFKSFTLLAYYTSEIGASQELAYLAIPGGYKGDYPFSKVGKAWSLN